MMDEGNHITFKQFFNVIGTYKRKLDDGGG